jgi:sarcosine oxidase
LELGAMPVWGVDRPGGGLFYGFPMTDDDLGLKVALHAPATKTDPDHVARHPEPGDGDEVRRFIQHHFPQAGGPLLSQRVCMYTNTRDFHFIIDKHPKHENVTIACGFSGHGFKFASVVGEILADLAIDGSTRHPIGFLGLHRFA